MNESRHDARWFALALVILAGLGLRYGTNILDYPDVRDELLMKKPVDDIVERGWSIETAIDYQEVKGPAFFWPYALGAQVIGNTMNDLRLISLLFFIGGAVPLLLIALRCGAKGWRLLLVAAFYVLLPYNAWIGQLFFSEPSFTFLGLWMMWAFVRSIAPAAEHTVTPARPVHSLGHLILFAVLFSVLLHHRPQAVALAGAAALVVFERHGVRSWPWLLACLLAGLSRLPLWMYWGGLVTSDYQGLFTFGFRLDPLTYLLAAMTPFIAVFLWPVLTEAQHQSRRWWVLTAGVIGALFGLAFSPDIFARGEYLPPGTEEAASQPLYMGVVATAVKATLPVGYIQQLAVALLAGFGTASLAAMFIVTWSRSPDEPIGVVCRLVFWMLAAGAPLYIVTAGPVYDRYLAVWVILLPIVWALTLPRIAIIAQALLTAGMLAYFVRENLF